MNNWGLIVLMLVLLIIVIILCYYYYKMNSKKEEDKNIPDDIFDKTNIVDIIRHNSENNGRKILFNIHNMKNDKPKKITYESFYNKCVSISEIILYHIGPYAKIGIMSSNRYETMLLYVSAIIAHRTPTIIDKQFDSSTIGDIILHSQIDVLLVDDNEDIIRIYGKEYPLLKMIIQINNTKSDEKYFNDIMSDIINDVKKNSNLKILSFKQFTELCTYSWILKKKIDHSMYSSNDDVTVLYSKSKKGLIVTRIKNKNIIFVVKSFVNKIKTLTSMNISIGESYMSCMPLTSSISLVSSIFIPLLTLGVINICDNCKHSLHVNDVSDYEMCCNMLVKSSPTILMMNGNAWKNIQKIIDNEVDKCKSYDIINKILINKIMLKNIGLSKLKLSYFLYNNDNDDKSIFDCVNYDCLKNIGIDIYNIYGDNQTTGMIAMCVPTFNNGIGIPLSKVKIDKQNKILLKGNNICNTSNDWLMTEHFGFINRDGTLYIDDQHNINVNDDTLYIDDQHNINDNDGNNINNVDDVNNINDTNNVAVVNDINNVNNVNNVNNDVSDNKKI